MAKRSKVARQEQREALVEKHRAKRDELKKASTNMSLSLEERMEARAALALMPRDGSKTRLRNRCKITGRPRGYLRRLGISRVMLRDLAHLGVLPGCRKASW